jgi:hypothetical protein
MAKERKEGTPREGRDKGSRERRREREVEPR